MPTVSICMVSLNCWSVLDDCLKSLRKCNPSIEYEIIVVDNQSTDSTPNLIAEHYPEVRLVQNESNVGFTRATNQGIELSKSPYLLWLNTDTVLEADTLHHLLGFLQEHPRAGIVGPKVLNPDGSFQGQCRRGLPTPLASFLYLIGLHRLFPSNRLAGQYLLSYLPIDEATQVDAVSGCCLLARREVWEAIGPLDESIFAYGEDIDWCIRAKQAGWQVWYAPQSVITHLKGQGGAHAHPYRKVKGIHQAVWVIYKKHLKQRYSWFVTVLVWLGIQASLLIGLVRVWCRRWFRFLVRK